MMVRWMCGVSLKDRKRSVDLSSLLGVQSVADVVRRSRLIIIIIIIYKFVRASGLDIWRERVWMIGYQPVERWRWQGQDVRGGIGRLGKSVDKEMEVLSLHPEFSGMCGGTPYGQMSNPSVAWK